MPRINYRQIWERHTGLKIPHGWHVHHIDGNGCNHDPENLNCISPTMHWWAHWLRGDPVARHGKFVQGAAAAARILGIRNRGRRWVTCLDTKEDRKVTKQEADKLLATKRWISGRTNGGWNNLELGKAKAIHSAGGKVAMAKRWSDLEERKRNGAITKERWANPEYKANVAKKVSKGRLKLPSEERSRLARIARQAQLEQIRKRGKE